MARTAPPVWFNAMAAAYDLSRRFDRRTRVYGVVVEGHWSYYVGWARRSEDLLRRDPRG